MAVVDPDYERHRRTWIGFTWFIKLGLLHVIVLLILMALFLL
ncbi:MAG: aa3-type cytochrome c oxidase subunit IV [Alphaproteobacteria bacterium]|nr:aa3-type cytochrome c oxidase subunit IV [Alphaproteobacteria bacterium]